MIVGPLLNRPLLDHPATQASLTALAARGVIVVPPVDEGTDRAWLPRRGCSALFSASVPNLTSAIAREPQFQDISSLFQWPADPLLSPHDATDFGGRTPTLCMVGLPIPTFAA